LPSSPARSTPWMRPARPRRSRVWPTRPSMSRPTAPGSTCASPVPAGSRSTRHRSPTTCASSRCRAAAWAPRRSWPARRPVCRLPTTRSTTTATAASMRPTKTSIASMSAAASSPGRWRSPSPAPTGWMRTATAARIRRRPSRSSPR